MKMLLILKLYLDDKMIRFCYLWKWFIKTLFLKLVVARHFLLKKKIFLTWKPLLFPKS